MQYDPTLWWVGPLVFNLVVMIGGWLYYSNRTSWSVDAERPRQLFRCQACGHVYVVAQEYPILRCPKCGVDNEVVKR